MTYGAELRERARIMKEAGLTYVAIAQEIGVSSVTIAKWLDPARAAAARAANSRKPSDFRPPQDKIDAVSLLASIPPDTRTLDERLNGTPLYGRRAIDKVSA